MGSGGLQTLRRWWRAEGKADEEMGGVRVNPPAPWIPEGGHQNAGSDPWWPKPLKLSTMDPVG